MRFAGVALVRPGAPNFFWCWVRWVLGFAHLNGFAGFHACGLTRKTCSKAENRAFERLFWVSGALVAVAFVVRLWAILCDP